MTEQTIPRIRPLYLNVQGPSVRKPHNDYAGYVFERKIRHNLHGGGHLVVIDRKNGGDWIDADHRWVILLEVNNTEGLSDAFVSFSSLKAARLEVYAAVADPEYDLWSLTALDA